MSSRPLMTRAVGIREFKTRLGRYLRDVRRGRTIVITDRGEPVAEVRPVGLQASGSGAEIDRLVALGHLTRESTAQIRPFRGIRRKGPAASDAVVQNREDRF